MRSELIKQYYDSTEYLNKLRARAGVLQECEEPLARSQIIADVWSCDPTRFIEDILFLKLVEYNNQIKPFFLFPYQKKILWKLVEAEQSGQDIEILIDKLRGMGMTWLVAAYMYWRWLFTPNWSGFILSRTESEVDDGTDSPDNSIFGKIRFFINHTPSWLMPEGFQSKMKKGTTTDSTLRLLNPVLKSSITGSSTNQNAGRSRRYSFVFIDECFFIEHFRSVWRALQSVARVKVYVSSVKQGRTAETFKDLIKAQGNYITLEYKDHPWKDDQWYKEKEKLAEFDPEVMKEVMVDYSVNIRDQYYPEIRQAQTIPLEYNPEKPLYSFIDVGKQDLTVLGWAQFDGNYLDILECYFNRQRELKWYIPFLNPEMPINSEFTYGEAQMEFLMRVRSWKKPVVYFGEQAHFIKVMPLNVSIAQVLHQSEIKLVYNKNGIKYEPRRHAVSLLLPKTRFNSNSDGAMEMYDALAQSRYVSTNAPVSKETTLKPKHDEEIGDFRAAFENLCVNVPRVIRHQRDEVGDNFRGDGFARDIIKYLRV